MPVSEPHKKLDEFLRSQGLKTTSQRRLIFDILMSQTRHVSVNDLHRLVQELDPRVGVATVYRTMNLLVEAGLATQLHFDDGLARFECALNVDHHDHLVCNTCGHIFEFENEEIEELQHKIAESYGLNITSHLLNIYGNCKKPETCDYKSQRS